MQGTIKSSMGFFIVLICKIITVDALMHQKQNCISKFCLNLLDHLFHLKD